MPQQRLEILYLTSHDSPDLEAYQGRGLDGLMIRLGQGGSLKDRTGKLDPYIDVGFPIHRASALVLGLPYGVVYQCASLTEEDAEVEGDWLLRQLSAIKEEIAAKKSTRVCQVCGKPCDKDDAYCSVCGAEL